MHSGITVYICWLPSRFGSLTSALFGTSLCIWYYCMFENSLRSEITLSTLQLVIEADSLLPLHCGHFQISSFLLQKQIPVILLPTHRSHLDYILITFILFNLDLKAPHVAAGDNLLMPIFGWVTQYWVKEAVAHKRTDFVEMCFSLVFAFR